MLPRPVQDALSDRRFDVLLWIAGALIAGLVAPLSGDELRIVTGCELALLALVRLALKQELRLFWWGVIATGVAMPLLAIGSVPLFYGGGLTLDAALMTGGLACAPGLATAGAGILGLRLHRDSEPIQDPDWLVWIDHALHAAIWIACLTFVVGVYAPLPVIASAILLALGLTAVVSQRMRWTRRGVGVALAWIGNTVAGTAALLLVTSAGHVSAGEALVAIIPAGVVGVAGVALALRGPRGD
ncbi:MAG: hypothetical protein GY884_12635 [Proteobacteria bacterium]|nr:hypothetical protein [Pseudomonadota bacterium]